MDHTAHVSSPTIFLSVIVTGAFTGVIALVLAGVLPLWLGILANILLAYVAFTPMHEGAHGNISEGKERRTWLDGMFGRISALPLFAPFETFRKLHADHHAHTNDPEKDPDYWVNGKNMLSVFLRCATILVYYYWIFLTHIRDHFATKKRALFDGVYTLLLYGGILVVAYLQGVLTEFLLLWILPAVIAHTILAFLLDWLPHQPHKVQERYLNTRVILLPRLSFLLLWQNFHLVHHLYPHVPFYRYKTFFKEIKQELKEHHSEIVGEDVEPISTGIQ